MTDSLTLDWPGFARILRSAIPDPVNESASEWCDRHVMMPGSARNPRFDCSITPWLREPLDRWGDDFTRRITFVKPIQSGGSAAGEAALCHTLATASSGDVQYNWEDNKKAVKRWKKRIERILRATKPVARVWPTDREKSQICLVIFPHLNLTVQGVHQDDNLDSDSVRFQINEEIHGWDPGRLAMADGRLTAFWDAKQFNISNASIVGDQLHEAFKSGTMQYLENKCPKCGLYHVMHTEADKEKPGGLRYDSEGCRREDGSYDYNRLEPTIYYECENPSCRFRIRDVPSERRALSLTGRYGEPTNTGAHLSNRSYTFEAVAVDYIPWIRLIMEKHQALAAFRRGDRDPWDRYLQRRECRFVDKKDRPTAQRIVLTPGAMKQTTKKDGANRILFADKQRGRASEGITPHFPVVIRDYFSDRCELVYEGLVNTEAEVEELRAKYEVDPLDIGVDSGHKISNDIYRFCAKFGYMAFKGDGNEKGERKTFPHYDQDEGGTFKVRRIFSEGELVDAYLGDREGRAGKFFCMFVRFCKQSIRDRMHWARTSGEFDFQIPEDVSPTYREHMEAEELDANGVWVDHGRQNDFFVCELGCLLVAEMKGIIGAPIEALREVEDDEEIPVT
jgi:phage FluMu protein Com